MVQMSEYNLDSSWNLQIRKSINFIKDITKNLSYAVQLGSGTKKSNLIDTGVTCGAHQDGIPPLLLPLLFLRNLNTYQISFNWLNIEKIYLCSGCHNVFWGKNCLHIPGKELQREV